MIKNVVFLFGKLYYHINRTIPKHIKNFFVYFRVNNI